MAGDDVAGGIANYGALTLINTTVTRNSATVRLSRCRSPPTPRNASEASLSLRWCVHAQFGAGGIWNGLAGSLTLIDSSVVHNFVDGNSHGGSGGISSCEFHCSVTLIRSTVAYNVNGEFSDFGYSNFELFMLEA